MIALDIGAGDTHFGKKLKQLNPSIDTVLCGDIQFQKQEYKNDEILSNIWVFLSRLEKILTPEEVKTVIENTKRGVYKTYANYRSIPLENESIDIVTLNSPHPFINPGKEGFREFQRVLKPGGIFYFGHSTDITKNFDTSEMELVGEGKFGPGESRIGVVPELGLMFPMSTIIRNNLIGLMLQERNRAGCIYGKGPTKIPIHPNWKAWKKL